MTWTNIIADEALALTSTVAYQREVYIEMYRDIRVQWVNDATAQTTFEVNLCLSTGRAKALS